MKLESNKKNYIVHQNSIGKHILYSLLIALLIQFVQINISQSFYCGTWKLISIVKQSLNIDFINTFEI